MRLPRCSVVSIALRRCVVVFASCLLVIPSFGIAAKAPVPEYELKLALLFNIARFVTWPEARSSRDDFRFCVVGTDPFGSAASGLEGRDVRGRIIAIERLQLDDAGIGDCDLAFIHRDADDRLHEVLDRLAPAASPVLTVSDAPGFAADGGVVGLSTRNNRVAIEINQRAQAQSGLTINAQLLRMATLVEPTEAAP